MDETIGVDLTRLEQCIDKLDSRTFTTADVIRAYLGHFCSDVGTPVKYSFNAKFGRLLRRNEQRLGITEIESNVSVTDDHDHATTASRWSYER